MPLVAGAMADFRDHGRNRHNADGKDAASDEIVRELLLPALNRPSTATPISSCPTAARALASKAESAAIS